MKDVHKAGSQARENAAKRLREDTRFEVAHKAFEPSPHDLYLMRERIDNCLRDVSRQLCDAPGFRVELFDVR